MATVVVYEEDIASLRLLIGEPLNAEPWTDVRLAEIIVATRDTDESVNLNRAAAMVWQQKASASATLVDVSESGSSRKLSDLHKNALAMQKHFSGLVSVDEVVPVDVSSRPRTRAIVRPGA